jgi:hypothetical protein
MEGERAGSLALSGLEGTVEEEEEDPDNQDDFTIRQVDHEESEDHIKMT